VLRPALVLALALPLVVAHAQRGGNPPSPAPDTATDVSWRNIGPNSAGRMVAVASSVARPNEWYYGTTGGGVWKSTDGGHTLVPVTDDYFGGTIGAIAVAETNPDIVYVGGGETPIRGNVSYGDGMWKTTDGGKTWTSLGLKETQQIGRVRLDPANPDIVYVAAMGHVWAPNKERGVYKSIDGGKTWKQTLFKNDSTGAIDLIMDPKNSNVLYAALWQAGRSPWMLISGGQGSGIYKSTDAGETWTDISRNPGLPAGLLGNIGLTVSPVNSNLVWALIENEPNGGVYKSSDAGATWTFMSGDRNVRQRAWYYSKIFADPTDTNHLFAPNVSAEGSRDGGKTWNSTNGFGGGDNHDMWIAPDGKRMSTVNDGGAVMTDGTTHFTISAPTGQFYHVHLTNHNPTHACGAKQDAGSSCGPIRGPIPVPGQGGRGGGGFGGGRGAVPATPAPAVTGPVYQDFYPVAGGESGYIASNPLNPDISYGGNYSGNLSSRDRISGRSAGLDPWPLNPMGHDAKDSKYRFQWTYPIMNSPHNPHVLYVGSNVVFKSDDDGMNFHIISPDLTRHDPKTLGASGGPISKDQTSVEYYATVFALIESPITPGLIWTGSDDGIVYVTRNGGTTWTNVTPKGLPEWMRISIIDASPHEPGTAWVAGNRYQLDDMHPYLYRTQDYGVTWSKISDGIPADEFTRAIREDLARPGMVYAATERSMYVSYDWGRNWQSLKRNLPPVPVHDIALKDDDMAIATHGRAFWVMEHLDALRNAPDAAAAKTAGKDFLYTPPLTPRAGNVLNVRYDLVDASQPVTLELLDRNGKVFKKVSSTDTIPTPTPPVGCFGQPAPSGGGGGRGAGAPTPSKVTNNAGTNRYAFNLRYANASTFQCMILWNNSMGGPTIAPGQYLLTMRVGTKPPITRQVRITRDPRSDASDADITEQVALALKVRDRLTETNDGVKTIRSIRDQLEAKMPAMDSNIAFKTLAKNLTDSLAAVEDSLYQTQNRAGEDPLNFPIRLNDQLGALNGAVLGNERKPTKQWYEIYGIFAPKVATQMARLRYITGTMVPRVNRALKAAGQDEIVPTTVETVPTPVAGKTGER
jgi:photosystem II stability/assembly factor-like uncharacterized protein